MSIVTAGFWLKRARLTVRSWSLFTGSVSHKQVHVEVQMLFKEKLGDLLLGQDMEAFFPHYERLVVIRFRFKPMEVPGLTKRWMPSCHHISHAYAQAFGVDVVDGEKVFITRTSTCWFGHFVRGKVSRYTHSWNVLTLPSGKRVILDLLPGETCSMLPNVTLAPHPAYTRHEDGVAGRCVTEFFLQPYEQERLDLLVVGLRRICEEI